ncbi:hypothetical protein NBRC116601_16310 [Cognatishimia sp. WU-CL00825]|uniref:glycosyltransferase family 2 protein n=1 Tax=Cognatishimia sp. WU-CL00825 TaxID=3127658 RepID=UPI003107B2D5
MTRVIISLTTIPPRFAKIGPTLRDLLAQDIEIAEIRLNLARQYRRFPGELPSLPALPEGITLHWSPEDFGPATKLLPTLLDHRNEDSTEILFCDDDQRYGTDWARQFLRHRRLQPDSCIVGKGYDLIHRPLGHRYDRIFTRFPRAQKRVKGAGYRLFRASTLCMIKPRPYEKDGYVDVLEGYRGAMVRPNFFPSEVFNIPEILWTVDDPWLSGHLERNGVPIWLMSDVDLPAQPYRAHFSDRLGAYVYRDHGRLAADTACLDYFRETYGIWQGAKEDSPTTPQGSLQHWLGKPPPINGHP